MERILVYFGNNICGGMCGNAYGKLIHTLAGLAYKEDGFAINIVKSEYRLIVSCAAKWRS